MIKSFKDAETEKVFTRRLSRRLPVDIQQTALRKLRMLNNATSLDDLRIPPANRLEKLSEDRAGNTAFVSMINGGFALNGKEEMPSG